MSNELDNKVEEHIINCYDINAVVKSVRDTGDSIVCVKCGEVIVRYE